MISPPNILLQQKSKEQHRRRNFKTTTFPTEVSILAAVLCDEGHEVKVLDCLIEDKDLKEIIADIEEWQPDFVVLTPFERCRWGLEGAISIANAIKDSKVVLAGSCVKELMVWVLENNQRIDYSVYGDPEETIKELISGRERQNIKGLIFRQEEKVVVNEPRPFIDIDDLPMANREVIKLNRYKKLPHTAVKEPCLDIIVSRGCPFSCTFCLLEVVGGRNYRLRSPEKIVEEIKFVKEKYKAKQINFGSLNFTVNRKWVGNLCELLIKEDLGVVWSCQARTDLVDQELLELMKKSGCVSILFGVESFSQELLNNIDKKMDVEANYKAIKLSRKVGIETRVSMMLGLPGETPEMVEKTVDELIKLEPDFVQFHATTAFPFTELYKEGDKWGKIIGIEDKSFDISGYPFLPKGYRDIEELKQVIVRAYRRFYLRPLYIIRKIFNFRYWQRYIKGAIVLLGIFKNK